MITPDYYPKFCCIGSKCKNNCCCGEWDIEVDDEAMERFNSISGEFCDRVRKSVDSNNIFIRKNGRCPLLSDDGLCEMVLNGEELCTVCDEYPRFTAYYGDYIERGISVSCEAAAKIILDNKEKVKFTGNTGECAEDIFALLISARKKILEILQDRTIDIAKRIRLVLNYGVALQDRINNNDYEEFAYIPKDVSYNNVSSDGLFKTLEMLDTLSDDWCDILTKHGKFNVTDEIKAEQLAVYFVYRYFLKAVDDCDAISKLKFMAVSVIAVVCLTNVCGNIYESARRYSIEVEHNEENIDMLYDEFLFNDDLNLDHILGMLST